MQEEVGMATTTEKAKQYSKKHAPGALYASSMLNDEAGTTTEQETRPVEKWMYVAGGAALALAGGALIARGVMGRQGDDIDHSPTASVGHNQGVRIEKTMTINKQPDALYRFWRNVENLPRFMEHLESVRVDDQTRSHWVVKAPAGQTVEWDAQIINDIPNELIAWQTTHADIANAGSVRFRLAPGGRGTEVTVNLEYDPPAGKVGQLVAKVFGEEPEQQVEDDLRHFKQIMEAGEIPTNNGQPTGR
jgi:uncharacterized membrane protein